MRWTIGWLEARSTNNHLLSLVEGYDSQTDPYCRAIIQPVIRTRGRYDTLNYRSDNVGFPREGRDILQHPYYCNYTVVVKYDPWTSAHDWLRYICPCVGYISSFVKLCTAERICFSCVGRWWYETGEIDRSHDCAEYNQIWQKSQSSQLHESSETGVQHMLDHRPGMILPSQHNTVLLQSALPGSNDPIRTRSSTIRILHVNGSALRGNGTASITNVWLLRYR